MTTPITYGYPLYPWEREWSQIYTYQWHLCDHGEFNANPDGTVNPRGYTFGPPDVVKTLAQIEAVDRVTRGIPKVIEMCGWQRYVPHCQATATWDFMFPSFTETDPAFCREGLQDPLGRSDPATDPNAAIRWLMEEAKRFNTWATFHVNYQSCGLQSPLRRRYLEAGALVVRDGKVWTGDSHHDGGAVNLAAEWDAGLFHDRIHALFEAFPGLRETKLLHVDYNVDWQGDGYTVADCENAMRRNMEYVKRAYGVDTSCELSTHREEFDYGTQCMALSFRREDLGDRWVDQMKVPAYVFCGGQAEEAGKGAGDNRYSDKWLMFGSSQQGEMGTAYTGPIGRDEWLWYRRDGHETGYAGRERIDFGAPDSRFRPNNLFRDFCYSTLSWYFLNRLLRLETDTEKNPSFVQFSGDVRSVRENGQVCIRRGTDEYLRAGNDLFVPALWKTAREIMAWSDQGYADRAWKLPAEWADVRAVDLYANTLAGLEPRAKGAPVADGRLALSLAPFDGVVIVPAGQDPDAPGPARAASGWAEFLGEDGATGGAWPGRYGTGGYWLPNASKDMAGVRLSFAGGRNVSLAMKEPWRGAALAHPDGSAPDFVWQREAALHQGLDLDTGGRAVRATLYALDTGGAGQMMVEPVDLETSWRLDSRSAHLLSGYGGGKYATWRVSGRVRLRLTRFHFPGFGRGDGRNEADPPAFCGLFLD